MNEISALLAFFRDIETMEVPSAPRLVRGHAPVTEFTSANQRHLPWNGRQSGIDDKFATFHLICLGVSEMRPLVERVLKAIAPDEVPDEEVMARQRGHGFLGTLLLDWRGRPLKGGLLPAPFVFGADRLANDKNLNGLDKEIAEKVEMIAEEHFGSVIQARDEPVGNGTGETDKPAMAFDFEIHASAMDFGKLVGLGKG